MSEPSGGDGDSVEKRQKVESSHGSECSVCLLSETSTGVLAIFDEANDGKQIARVIWQHLRLELIPTERKQFICTTCWHTLKEFHEFYVMVEQLHTTKKPTEIKREVTPVPDGRSEVPLSATEFVAVKDEPVDDNTDDDDDDDDDDEDDEDDDEDDEEGDEREHETNGLDVSDDIDTIKNEKSAADAGTVCGKRPKAAAVTRRLAAKRRLETGKFKVYREKVTVDQELLDFYQRIVCETCDVEAMTKGEPPVVYNTLKQLTVHNKRVHGKERASLKCPICEKRMWFRARLLQHKDMHLNPDKYRCEVCAEVHQNLEEHMKNKHRERHFCCELCGKRFPFQQRLKAHMRKIHTAKDEICEHCQKPFSKYTLEDHKRKVHGASFVCAHCPKTFKNRFWLDRHMEEHDGIVRNTTVVTCEVCNSVMKDKYNLASHMKRIHMEQSPVNCGTCGKTFKSKHNLNAHLKNVCTDRTFPCTFCGKPFKQKVKLTEHMTTHTGKALYMCSFCPKTFSFETQLYTHRKQAHHEEWLDMQKKRKAGIRFKANRVIN